MNRKSDEERIYPRLERLLTDLDELLRLRRRLTTDAVAGGAGKYAGFSTFIDAVLPTDGEAEGRIARAIRMHESALRQFRRRELDPANVPPDSLTTLGRCAALDWSTFDALVARDLTWFAEESPLAMLRDNTADPAEVRRSLRVAWERDALDDPTRLETGNE